MDAVNPFETSLKHHNSGYETFFEKQGTAVMIIGEDMSILRVNDLLETISGYRKKDLVNGSTFIRFVHPDDRDKLVRHHKTRRIDPESVPPSCRCRLLHSDGQVREYALSVSLIPGTRKSIISFHDTLASPVIRPLKTSQAQMFRLMAENTTDQVFIADLDANILYISPSVENISGYTQEEFKLLSPKEYFTPSSYEKAKKMILKCIEGRYDITKPFLTEY
jgi:PAS domain S-box-containing protein